MIVHLHIPKTGGTTLLTLLSKNYPHLKRLRNGRGWDGAKIPKMTDCVSAHMPYGMLPIDNPEYITFIRDPVDRLLSFYYYVTAKGDTNNWGKQIAGRNLEWFLNSGLQDNEQVRLLAGVDNFETPVTQAHVDLAIKHLSTFKFVGLFDRLAEDVKSLAMILGWTMPSQLPHKLPSDNKGVESLSPSLLRIAQEKTRYDNLIYEWTKSR